MHFLPLSLLVFLAMAAYSNAAYYCVCNTATSDPVLQKNIDYACGAGADCGQISPNGPCFNPNTVRDHCNFAVNSYFQKKVQVQGSCDFAGTAMVSQTPPSGANSACYSSTLSPGTGTGTTPTGTGMGTPTSGTGTGTPPGAGTGTPPPGTGTGTGTLTPVTGNGTGTGIGTGTGTGTGTGINVNPPLGLLPPSTNNGFGDNSGSVSLHQMTNLFSLPTLMVSGLIWFRVI